MKRRKFLSFSILAFLPSTFLSSCNKSRKNDAVNQLNCFQDTLFEYYNSGKLNEVFQLYDQNCTYAADSISGGIEMAEKNDKKSKSGMEMLQKSLNILYKYQNRNEILPLKIENRKTVVSDNICWIVSKLTPYSQKRKHGFLTQIFKRNQSGWKIIHHHFSS